MGGWVDGMGDGDKGWGIGGPFVNASRSLISPIIIYHARNRDRDPGRNRLLFPAWPKSTEMECHITELTRPALLRNKRPLGPNFCFSTRTLQKPNFCGI